MYSGKERSRKQKHTIIIQAKLKSMKLSSRHVTYDEKVNAGRDVCKSICVLCDLARQIRVQKFSSGESSISWQMDN